MVVLHERTGDARGQIGMVGCLRLAHEPLSRDEIARRRTPLKVRTGHAVVAAARVLAIGVECADRRQPPA